MVEPPPFSTSFDPILSDPCLQHSRRGVEQNVDDLFLSRGEPCLHLFPVGLDQDRLDDEQVIAGELRYFGSDQRNQ